MSPLPTARVQVSASADFLRNTTKKEKRYGRWYEPGELPYIALASYKLEASKKRKAIVRVGVPCAVASR